jgi:uncharacterized protein (TIGR03437 family)
VDGTGNLYIADGGHRIRRVSPNGIITTVAGTGTGGYSGDGGLGTEARLLDPTALVLDTSGNLYIAETSGYRIRRISTAGIITTVAGTGDGGYSGDGGPAVNAQVSSPSGVAVDGLGNLYIADYGNHRIRKVSAAGVITTVAGDGGKGYSGDGGVATRAQLMWPAGVAVDVAGSLYIAQPRRVRKVSPAGIITTVAGVLSWGYSGDGGSATNAEFNEAVGVAADASGRVYVVDSANNAIRVLLPSGVQPLLTVQAARSGNFALGQRGVYYTLTVANATFAGSSNGPVSLTARIPAGLTLISMTGPGWNCVGCTCLRSDVLAGGASYPPVTALVNVAPDAPWQMTAQFSVTGGGGLPAGVSDLTTIESKPSVGSVVSAASFLPGIVDGSWVSILGTNLSATTRSWRDDEIVDGRLPTTLDGVSVTIGGLPAAISYISPTQLNVQAPATGKTGPVIVVVNNNLATSPPVNADLRRNAPGLFVFIPGGGKYPAALVVSSDGATAYLGPAGLFGTALATRPARPGEILVLYATGLGPTDPPVTPGLVFSGAARTTDPVAVTVGGMDAPVAFAGLVSPGLYQLNATVPNVAPGDQALLIKANGVSSQPGVFAAIGR